MAKFIRHSYYIAYMRVFHEFLCNLSVQFAKQSELMGNYAFTVITFPRITCQFLPSFFLHTLLISFLLRYFFCHSNQTQSLTKERLMLGSSVCGMVDGVMFLDSSDSTSTSISESEIEEDGFHLLKHSKDHHSAYLCLGTGLI